MKNEVNEDMEVSPFLPLCDGFHIEQVTELSNILLIHISSRSPRACCPLCAVLAERIHSPYPRRVAYLPSLCGSAGHLP